MAGPGPLGPIAWAARAERLGMATRGGPVPPGPPPANPNPPPADPDDPDAEYAAEMRDIQRQDRLDRLADMRDEAEDRRRIRRLRRKQELAKLEAQADGLVPDRGRGYDDDGEGEQIAAIRRELSAERSDLKAQIDRLQGVITKSNEDTLKAQIDRLSQKIDDIQKTPGTDPVQAISSAFELAGKIRNQVDSLLPIPAPPPIDPGLSHQQVLDRERAQLEHDIYRLERQEALETVQYKREQLRADREKATERWQGIVNGLGQVGGALSQALAPTLAGMLPAGIGGGPSAPGAPGAPPGMGMATAPPPATGPPPTPQGIPYVCPSSTCRKTNYVPPGTGIARCDHCGFGPVYLQPHGTPPPAGMVNSV